MKKFWLLFIVLIFTGCSANYSLNINSDFVKEKMDVQIPFDVIDAESLKKQATSRTAYDNNLYEFSEKLDSDNYLLNYSYKYDIDKYFKSSLLVKCYEKSGIENTDDVFSINTSERFNCIQMEDDFYLDEVKISIATDLKVLENNADKKLGNVYIWNIDYYNYMNKPIIFKVEKNILDKAKNVFLSSNFLAIVFVFLIFGIIIYSVIKNAKRKHEENNNI